VPKGYVLRKHDDNGLLLHWRDWWLEPVSVKGD